MSAALQTFDLVKSFGGITATDHVDFTLAKGARHALIGPNGAGKTTFVNQLTGVLKPSSGRIALMGEDITGLPREARVKRGLARTFQINQLFATMTPLEMIALVISERLGRGSHLFRTLDRDTELVSQVADILSRFRLDDIMDRTIATLPYGKQRQIEIAAAFAARPSVLLLDEPAAGVPEAERRELMRTVADLPADVSVLLIEHDMDVVFRFATRITVLVNGRVLAEGTPEEMARNAAVREAYLGEDAHV
ncbi:MAG: ABC transporter ATP-binding protein [Bosea sp.]|uniref:ABC transporter ATP-binding protein n=1 Tax=unclassified Bosea (in: a-proteobacteria) TaxID=2653178 RepID=UPI00095C75BF|nr:MULTISPECIES: ABC transporter ATP-binding protein [unclassified Bosea (in: a-proteobacteria)]MBN9455063.1 ABC transporter ATP-binding protein [Bosea sp. (in: a-proteobacteria)]OJV04727.1 MAG: branched-chain amino acid ABC transporter ATP-binding protein [Bosea sp. 67-29]